MGFCNSVPFVRLTGHEEYSLAGSLGCRVFPGRPRSLLPLHFPSLQRRAASFASAKLARSASSSVSHATSLAAISSTTPGPISNESSDCGSLGSAGASVAVTSAIPECPADSGSVLANFCPLGNRSAGSSHTRFSRSGLRGSGALRSNVGSGRRRARKLRLRLGGDPTDDEYPDKPPRMRWTTYNRLLDKLRAADGVADERLRRVLIN